MAMITISKGEKSLRIPAGALKSYVAAGWSLGNEPQSSVEAPKSKAQPIPEPEPQNDATDTNPEPEEDTEDEEDDEEYEEIEVDPEELLTRPLGELDFEDLKIVAEYLGIDASKYNTSKKLRDEIKKVKK